ncbi:MAG TPA: pilus assembly protein PilM [Solirubrobacteraceae bacterium]|jgi:type IV pilus assembly protein PilM|nr:pilus assembly protein PilM [Solirubrobacteraceae bacterium]
MASLKDIAKMEVKAPSLRKPSAKMSAPKLRRGGGSHARSKRSSGSATVGLDIQPGYVAAVQARANGSVVVQRAVGLELPPETVREGELLDESLLTEALRELFHDGKLPRRVRLGVANQRTVLRVLELPPIDDRKALDAAVRFQAQDHMPMPLANAVLDFQPLGIVGTPAGPRQRVVVVAAQRDMVQRLLKAVQAAGLRPTGVDLSAFAMIRALHQADASSERMPNGLGEGEVAPVASTLYLNVGGLTNLAIAEGLECRFTRMVSGGLESIASELAERHSVALPQARELMSTANLINDVGPVPETAADLEVPVDHVGADVRAVLASGVREIAGEVRNSLDFHRSQGGGEVGSVVLSGPALEISGFAQALEAELGAPLSCRRVQMAQDAEGVPAERLTIAAGLAIEEVTA